MFRSEYTSFTLSKEFKILLSVFGSFALKTVNLKMIEISCLGGVFLQSDSTTTVF